MLRVRGNKEPDSFSLTITVLAMHFSQNGFVNLSRCNANFAMRLLLKNETVQTLMDTTTKLQPLCKCSNVLIHFTYKEGVIKES